MEIKKTAPLECDGYILYLAPYRYKISEDGGKPHLTERAENIVR